MDAPNRKARQMEITAKVKAGNDAVPIGENMNAWTVTLERSDNEETLEVPFFTGLGLTGEPTAADVVGCLLSDWSGWFNSTGFEDWALDYGYDPDSRKAEATYRKVERSARAFGQWAGDIRGALEAKAEADGGELAGDPNDGTIELEDVDPR